VSRSALAKMLSQSAVKNSISPAAHMTAVANLDKLFPLAVQRLERAPEKEGDAGRIAGMHHFDAPMPFEGEVLRAKMLVKRLTDPQQGNRLYTVSAVEIGKPASLRGASPLSEQGSGPTPPAGFEERFARLAEAVKGAGKAAPEAEEPPAFARGDGDEGRSQGDRADDAIRLGRALDVTNKPLMQAVGRGSIRHAFAVLDRVSAHAERALRETRAEFDKMLSSDEGKTAIRQTIDQWETGQKVTDPRMAPFFQSMKRAFDQRVQAVIASGREIGYLDNYLPPRPVILSAAKNLASQPDPGDTKALAASGILPGSGPVSTWHLPGRAWQISL
jgi:hypothetical protein